MLLCFACVEILCALVHQSDVFYSSVLQFFCVLPFSLRRSQWNGCAKASRRVLVLQYWRAILKVFCKSLSKSYCSGCVKVAQGLWQQVFVNFSADDFPLKISFKKIQKVLQSQNRRFCAWASGSGFGAPICVAVVCNSFVFRNSVSADRSGMMAASRFLAAAAA